MNILKILYGSYSLICSAGALSSLWYLTCLFVSILLSKMVVSRSKNVSMIIAAACVCFLAGILLPRISYGYPFCFDIALIASAFILFGHLFEKYFISCKTIVRVLFLIIGLSVTLITPNTFDNGKYIVLANKDIGNPLFFAASAVGGCLFVYGTARIISNFAIPRFIETGLTFIGDNSLTILLVHKPFIELVQRFLPSGISPVFQLMLAFIVTMIFSAVSAKIIGLLFPFIIGKTAKASGAH